MNNNNHKLKMAEETAWCFHPFWLAFSWKFNIFISKIYSQNFLLDVDSKPASSPIIDANLGPRPLRVYYQQKLRKQAQEVGREISGKETDFPGICYVWESVIMYCIKIKKGSWGRGAEKGSIGSHCCGLLSLVWEVFLGLLFFWLIKVFCEQSAPDCFFWLSLLN